MRRHTPLYLAASVAWVLLVFAIMDLNDQLAAAACVVTLFVLTVTAVECFVRDWEQRGKTRVTTFGTPQRGETKYETGGQVITVDFGIREQTLIERAMELHPSNWDRVFDGEAQ